MCHLPAPMDPSLHGWWIHVVEPIGEAQEEGHGKCHQDHEGQGETHDHEDCHEGQEGHADQEGQGDQQGQVSLCNASIWHHDLFEAMDGHTPKYDGKNVCRHGMALEDSSLHGFPYYQAIIGFPFFVSKISVRKSHCLLHSLLQAFWLPTSSSHHGFPFFDHKFMVDHFQALWLPKYKR